MSQRRSEGKHDLYGRSFATYQRGAESRDRFCVDCGYNLRSLTRGECPECGRGFSQDDPRSYVTSDQQGGKPLPWFVRRVAMAGGAFVLSCVLPWLMVRLAASGLDLSATCCCGYILFWPLVLGSSTYLFMEAVMPEDWTGVWVNVVAGMALAGVVMMGPLLISVGPQPLLMLFGWCIGLPVGLWRAHQKT